MEVGYRRGLVEKFELGAKGTIPGTVGIDGKYQLVSAGKFAVAAGLGTGYLSIESGSDDVKTSTKLFDAIVPLYVSYDVAKPFAVYASPKYAARYATSTDAMGETSSGASHLVGATAGMRVGNGFGLFLELARATYARSEYLFMDYVSGQMTGGRTSPADVKIMEMAIGGPYWFWGPPQRRRHRHRRCARPFARCRRRRPAPHRAPSPSLTARAIGLRDVHAFMYLDSRNAR